MPKQWDQMCTLQNPTSPLKFNCWWKCIFFYWTFNSRNNIFKGLIFLSRIIKILGENQKILFLDIFFPLLNIVCKNIRNLQWLYMTNDKCLNSFMWKDLTINLLFFIKQKQIQQNRLELSLHEYIHPFLLCHRN